VATETALFVTSSKEAFYAAPREEKTILCSPPFQKSGNKRFRIPGIKLQSGLSNARGSTYAVSAKRVAFAPNPSRPNVSTFNKPSHGAFPEKFGACLTQF